MKNYYNSNINESKNIRIKNKNYSLRKVFISGLILILLSLLMFTLGIGMFVSQGSYSPFTIKFSEVCFIFWSPFLIVGVLLTCVSMIVRLITPNKN